MKILHILDHSLPLHSGYTFRTRAILEQQKSFGWETFQVTSAKQTGVIHPVEEAEGLTFYRSEQPPGLLTKLPLLDQWAIVDSLARRLDEIIPDIKPDVLHAHSPALNGLAALRAGKKHHLPVVYECRAFWEDAAVDHGTTTEGSLRYRFTRALENYVFKKTQAITTICEGLRNDIHQRGISSDKITVIPNAVDVYKFRKNNADEVLSGKLGLQNARVLGFIGSFYAYEGLALLLEAMPEIIREHPDARLLLVGGGRQESNLKQRAGELNLEDKVLFVGRVPHDQVQRYYDLVDIFVYPRLSMRLTELVTPLKPLEAMAQGKLVVASDVGGHRELITDQNTGFLFKANDQQDLAQKVIVLLKQPGRSRQIRENARAYVEEQRNWPASVAVYRNVYSRLSDVHIRFA